MNKYETLKKLLKDYQQGINEYTALIHQVFDRCIEEGRDETEQEIKEQQKLYNENQKLNDQIVELTGINWYVIFKLAKSNSLNALLVNFN